MARAFGERELVREFTGMVVAGMAVRPGLDDPSAACRRCGDALTLGVVDVLDYSPAAEGYP